MFVDTSFLVATIDRSDSLNRRAGELAVSLHERRAVLLTTDAVLIELANYFSRSLLRGEAGDWVAAIRGNADWQVVPHDAALIADAERRFRRHADKTWSMTDCLSMEVMAGRGVAEVATADRGFAQAGFIAVLI